MPRGWEEMPRGGPHVYVPTELDNLLGDTEIQPRQSCPRVRRPTMVQLGFVPLHCFDS
jgi:hypothetical protein